MRAQLLHKSGLDKDNMDCFNANDKDSLLLVDFHFIDTSLDCETLDFAICVNGRCKFELIFILK